MNRPQPSSLVLAILRFVEFGNEALAGDLAEELRAGRSRTWLWRQLIRAAFTTAWRKRTSEDAMNLRGSRVRGVGGGGLLGTVMLITIVLPQAWFVVASGIAGGVVIGVVMIVRRHARGLTGPDDSAPLTLFGGHDADAPVTVYHGRSDGARLATV